MLVDRPRNRARFLLLGSASPALVVREPQEAAGEGAQGLSGLLHTLLGLTGEDELAGHPKVGASFEGFAIEQVLAVLDAGHPHYWATHGGAELDLLIERRGARHGFECKLADAPGVTRSMRVALADLGLDHLWVLYPGDRTYPLDDRITVLPAARIPRLAKSIR